MNRLIFLALFLLILAACKNINITPPTSPETNSEPVPTILNEESIFNARMHLAEYLGIDPGLIVEKDVKVVEWPDASLGCPQSGMMYAQVITPGYKIMFEIGGIKYTYHTDMHGFVVLCKDSGE
jgi:hypothetical protein